MFRRKKLRAVRQKTLIQTTVIFVFTFVLSGMMLSYYFIASTSRPKNYVPISSLESKPSPTPIYLPLINESPDFVGQIEKISLDEITLRRADDSHIILSITANTPIYEITNLTYENFEVDVLDINSLQIGNTVSVYSESSDLIALFLLHE